MRVVIQRVTQAKVEIDGRLVGQCAKGFMILVGAQVGDTMYTTGGACRSALWLRIRAAILNRRLRVPKVVDAAMGSALVAASGDLGSLSEAAGRMIQYEKTVDPDPALAARYEEIYQQFKCDLSRRLNGFGG